METVHGVCVCVGGEVHGGVQLLHNKTMHKHSQISSAGNDALKWLLVNLGANTLKVWLWVWDRLKHLQEHKCENEVRLTMEEKNAFYFLLMHEKQMCG